MTKVRIKKVKSLAYMNKDKVEIHSSNFGLRPHDLSHMTEEI